MLQKIIDILAKYSKYDKSKINRETSLAIDLGLTSLEVVQIVLELENEYGVEFDEDKLESVTTVGDIEDLIKSII